MFGLPISPDQAQLRNINRTTLYNINYPVGSRSECFDDGILRVL